MMGVIIVIIILALLMIFGVRNDQKVSHNMILMSKYKGQLHGGNIRENWPGLTVSPFPVLTFLQQ